MHAVYEINFDDDIKKVLEETSQMYLEIEDIDNSKMQAIIVKEMMMKDGITISSLMTDEEVVLVDTFLKENFSLSLKC